MGVDVSLPDDLRLTEQVQALLYRIVQEAIRNIVHHAQASEVSIHVETRHGHTMLRVKDDGIGFASGGRAAPRHIGMRTMADLAQEASALLQVTAAPGRGTTLVMELPS